MGVAETDVGRTKNVVTMVSGTLARRLNATTKAPPAGVWRKNSEVAGGIAHHETAYWQTIS